MKVILSKNKYKTNFKASFDQFSSELLTPSIMIVGPSPSFSPLGYKMYHRSISGMANFNTSFKIFATKLPIKNFHGRYNDYRTNLLQQLTLY